MAIVEKGVTSALLLDLGEDNEQRDNVASL